MKTFPDKQLEEINHAHIVFLLYKVITSATDSDSDSIEIMEGNNKN